eukprot:COSAG04_NODE_2457_length_4090_cov_4.282315_5_plen_33_part_00
MKPRKGRPGGVFLPGPFCRIDQKYKLTLDEEE